jgi:translocation and assembly module TamB
MIVLRRILAWALLLLSALAIALPCLAVWLLSTEFGNGLLLRELPRLLKADISVGAREGSLTGDLKWRDVVYEDDQVRVQLREVALSWKPLLLLEYRVGIDRLFVDGLDVRLKDAPEAAPKPPSTSAPLSRLPVSIDIKQLQLRDANVWTVGAEAPIAIPQAAFTGSWIGSRVRIRNLEAEYAPVGFARLVADARLSAEGVTLHRLKVTAPVDVEASGFVGYQAASDLKLSWKALRWPLLALEPESIPMVTSAKGEATLKGLWNDLEFAIDAALGDAGQVQGKGRWNGALDADLSWTGLTWPMTVPPVAEPPAYRSARGRVLVRGQPEHYRFDLDAALQAQQYEGDVVAKGSGSLESVDLAQLHLAIGEASIEAEGALRWAPQPAGSLKGKLVRVDPGVVAAAWPGQLNGDFVVSGEPAGAGTLPSLRFEVQLADSQLRGYPLRLEAKGRYAESALQVEQLHLQSGSSEVSLSGRASEPYDLKAQLTSPKLQELAPGLVGSAKLSAAFAGSLDKPKLSVDGSLQHAGWQDYVVDKAALHADIDLAAVSTIRLDANGLTVGTRLDEVRLDGSGTQTDHRLALTVASRDGEASLKVAGGYDAHQRLWQGALTESRIAPTNLAAWILDQPANLTLSANQNQIDEACWASDRGSLCLQAQQAAASISAAVRVRQLAFDYFETLMPDKFRLQGEVSGEARVELRGGEISEINADLTTTEGFVGYDKQRFGLKPGRIVLSDAQEGRIEVNLPLDVGGLQGQARIAPGPVLTERELSGELRLDFPDLAFVQVLSTEISSVKGSLGGRYEIAGTVGAPRAIGNARLAAESLKLTRPGIELTEVEATVTGEPDGRIAIRAKAKSGGGELNVEASVENQPLTVEPISGLPPLPRETEADESDAIAKVAVDSANEPPVESNPNDVADTGVTGPPPPEVLPTANSEGLKLIVQVDGKDFQVANLPEARVWASPGMRLTVSGQQASLKGVFAVPRAEIKLQQGEDTGVAPSEDQIIVDASGRTPDTTKAFQLGTEVKVVLGDRVKIEGFGLKARLEGDLIAVDQPGRNTIGYGEVRIEDGQYKAYGQDLVIETGKVLFNGGPIDKPGLEIRALRRDTLDVKVGIYVRGTLEQPKLTLYSEPSMTQQQQLSWLLLGRPLDQSSTSEDRSMLSGAALALGLGGGTLLAQNLRKGLGVDEISLGAAPGESNENARLTVGKYLSPKLFVSYGIGLFQPGSVFKLLYDLGKGFKVSTETGAYAGGDLLYTIERP